MDSPTPPFNYELESWYKQTVKKLYFFVYSYVSNREEAEDITQEAYYRCLRLNPESLPPYSYLKQTARNLIIDGYRHRSVVQEHLPKLQSDEPSSEEDWVEGAVIRELWEKLPPDYQEVLELRIIQGYSRKETAQIMGRSEDSIRGLQYRALQTLRELKEHLKGGDSL